MNRKARPNAPSSPAGLPNGAYSDVGQARIGLSLPSKDGPQRQANFQSGLVRLAMLKNFSQIGQHAICADWVVLRSSRMSSCTSHRAVSRRPADLPKLGVLAARLRLRHALRSVARSSSANEAKTAENESAHPHSSCRQGSASSPLDRSHDVCLHATRARSPEP